MLGLMRAERDDIEQEAALYHHLTGRRANKRIIALRLQKQQIPVYGDMDLSGAVPLAEIEETKAPDYVYDQLLDWMFNIDKPPVYSLLYGFFEAPQELLEYTLRELARMGYITPDGLAQPKAQRVTLSDMMFKALPTTQDSLVKLVALHSPQTARPEATVRQWLRRNTRKGTIYLEESQELYHGVP